MTLLQRRSLLLVLVVSVAYAYLVVPVHAQTISISNLQYPSTVSVNGQLTVSFTTSYSGAAYNDYLAIFIWSVADNSFASGRLLSSSPQTCQQDTTGQYSNSAVCIFRPSTQGLEDVVFSLPDTSAGTFSFDARAILGYTSTSCTNNLCVDADSGNQPFSVSIVNQFTLTVNAPGQVPVTLDGVQQGAGSISQELSPGTHSISIPQMVPIDPTSRLVFVGWSDGSNQTARTFDLESDTEITANYVTQYYVSTTSDSTLQSGWYNSGVVVQLSVNEAQPWESYSVLVGGFDGWYSNGQLISSSPSSSIQINSPLNLSVRWNYLPYLPPLLVVAIVGALVYLGRGGVIQGLRIPKLTIPKRSRKRTRRRKPKTEAVTPEVEKQASVTQATEITAPVKAEPKVTPAKTTMYCTQCGAVILRDSKFCKECGSKIG